MITRWIYIGFALTITYSVAYWMGATHARAQAEAKWMEAVLATERTQHDVTERVEQAHEVQQQKIQTVFRDRIIYRDREVPSEIIVRENAACIVPERFVSVWNGANRLQLPDAASIADETPSAVKLSDIEAQHEREAELCHTTAEQLRALQQWVRDQAVVAREQ